MTDCRKKQIDPDHPDCWNFCLLEKGKEKGGTGSKWRLVFSDFGNLQVITFLSSHSQQFLEEKHLCYL